MSVNHHPGEELLWDYYRGALPAGKALLVRTHLELCVHCRADLKLFDSIGAAMLEDVEGVPLADNALDLALARIERPGEAPVMPVSAPLPAFLQGFELPPGVREAATRGRYWAAPGVWMAPVDTGTGTWAKTFLMFVKAGMTMPEHTHRGLEMTLVLKGRFSDKNGDYALGDITCCDDDICHSPAIAADEDCLCLVYQEAPIIPKTWLGKVLQPFARI